MDIKNFDCEKCFKFMFPIIVAVLLIQGAGIAYLLLTK